MKQLQKNVLFSALGILGVLVGTSVLVAIGQINAIAFVIAAAACIPMAKPIWAYALREYNNPLRILKGVFPKIGFKIENTEWNEDHTAVRFFGDYHDVKMMFQASLDSMYVLIYDLPWTQMEANDPAIPRMMETVNEVNSIRPNMSVVVCEPNDEGMRRIYTLSQTVLPTYNTDQYIDSLLYDILNCRCRIHDCFDRERPYMTARRSRMGFDVSQEAPKAGTDDDSMAPAAKKTHP